ncbi:MAG TPA: hypothetical protein VLG09_02620 [Candidatus Saccharimonadales bacterium]|nr:hypothetical protein [Candidatus Saccharimonadales bacterium]
MPLNTQIKRDGDALIIAWGSFHVAAMIIAASYDSGKGPFEDNTEPEMAVNKETGERGHYISPSDCFLLCDYGHIAMTPLNDGPYTLTRSYTFVDGMDGEVFTLQAGDVLKMWRD